LAAFNQGCRCGVCRDARRAYDRAWFAVGQVLRLGVVNRRVPVGRTAEHIGRLREAGWSVRDISAVSGWSRNTVDRIVRLDRAGAGGRCWSLVERSVLGIDP